MAEIAYRKGLHELGDGLFAYLQPDGGWGWSNAGLITADGTSLLVDTLYDLALTREMLDAMASLTARHPIDAALNTHSNPDHCFGNELLPTATRDLRVRRHRSRAHRAIASAAAGLEDRSRNARPAARVRRPGIRAV